MTLPPPGTLTPLAFALLGLSVGGHCALMCGPLQALATPARAGMSAVLSLQLGRVLAYALAGGLVAAAGASFWPQVASWPATTARWLLLLALGLLLLRQAAPRCPRGRAPARGPAWLRGASLIFVPCPLLFGALSYALLAAEPLQGAALLFAFGLGSALPLTLAVCGLRRALWRLPRGPELAVGYVGLLGSAALIPLAWGPVGLWCRNLASAL